MKPLLKNTAFFICFLLIFSVQLFAEGDGDDENEDLTCVINGPSCILKTKSATYTATASGGKKGSSRWFSWSIPPNKEGSSINYSDTAQAKSVILSCTVTDSDDGSATATKQINVFEGNVVKIIAHCDYASTKYNGSDKTEEFDGHETDFGDPCSLDNPGQALIIFRDDVSYANGNIKNFSIDLTAHMNPTSGPYHKGGLGESWTQTPSSGNISWSDALNASFNNPDVGGLYKIKFDFMGKESSGVNILLPLAGPDILNWLDQEIRTMKKWTIEKQTEAFYYCWNKLGSDGTLGDYMDELEEIFIKYSGREFDYQFDALNNDKLADYCYRFAHEHNDTCAARCYITVKGNVIYFAKINNMLWGLFGRYWGYPTWELRSGAHWHEFKQHIGLNIFEWRLDPGTSQAGIKLGGDIYKKLKRNSSGNLSSWFSANRWKELVDDNELNEERLWPSNKPLNIQASKLAISKPQLIP